MVKSTRFILVAAIFLAIAWFGVQSPAFGSNGPFDSGSGSGREWINLAGIKAGGSDAGDGISRIMVAGSSDTALVLKVSLPGMYLTPTEMSDGKMYTAVTTPGSGMSEVGKPAVPLFGKWILIPNGTGVELDIDPGSPLIFKDISVPPVQHPPLIFNSPLYNRLPGMRAFMVTTRPTQGSLPGWNLPKS